MPLLKPVQFKCRSEPVQAAEIKRLDSQQNSFECVYFSGALFISRHKFSTETYFNYAIFTRYTQFTAEFEKGTYFWGAEFRKEIFFEKSYFSDYVGFSNADFNDKASFSHSYFGSDASFHSANFSEESHLSFVDSDIRKSLCFNDAQIKGYVSFLASPYVPDNLAFNGEDVALDLQDAKLEKPEQISFHSVRLRPNWFINVDSRKFNFINVKWENVGNNFNKSNVKNELGCLKNRKIENPKQLFKIACRQLSESAETNSRFEEASNFRRMAMETEWLEKKEIGGWTQNSKRRSEKLLDIFRNFRDFIIHGLYRLTSAYGESWSRALFILFVIIAAFTVYFRFAYLNVCPKLMIESMTCVTRNLSWEEAFHQSFMTGALQSVEYRKTITEGEDVKFYWKKYSHRFKRRF